MNEVLRKIRKGHYKMLVIGDSMLDSYVRGTVQRISPEAPVPVFRFNERKYVLGGAANVASNLAAMNIAVFVMSVVGIDEGGKKIIELLNEKGVNTDFIVKSEEKVTTIKERIVSGNQQMLRIDTEDTKELSEELEMRFLSLYKGIVSQMDMILLSDYQKGMLSYQFCRKLIVLANESNIKVIVDVKAEDATHYYGAYLLKPNRIELSKLTGMILENPQNIVKAMRIVKRQAGCKCVLTTLGENGMILLDQDDEIITSNIETKQVYDVVGAGDTAFSYIALGLVQGLQSNEMLMLANAAAAIKVTKSGTAVVTIEELRQKYGKAQCKLQDINSLVNIVNNNRDKKIVFTNGCFDILHLGHIKYLKKAKRLGDILIVAVNSDASVKRLKGENRPINLQQDRMEMLAELDFVDYIVSFEEDTPYELIKKINPDVLVKGGDYQIENIVGREIVEKKGGLVTTIPFIEGKSTTGIIRALNRSIERGELRG